MALASEDHCFMTEEEEGRGGGTTLYRVTHTENMPVSWQKPHSVTVSVHACVYDWTEKLCAISMNPRLPACFLWPTV